MKQADKTLQEALIQNNVLDAAQAQDYFSDADFKSQPFKDYLLEKRVVSEKQILISLSQKLNIDIIDFQSTTVEKSVIERIPSKFALYYKFMPVKIEEETLTIATSSPMDLKIQDELRMHLGLSIKVALCEQLQLADALKQYYGFAADTIDRIKAKRPVVTATPAVDSDNWIEDLERQSENPTVSNLVNQIILEAYHKRATDIHIEPYRDKVRFRYRIDGVLIDANLSDDVRPLIQPILSRIKILANLSITEKRLPQDGSAVVKTKDQQLDLRISTMPTPRGESMVIRILPTKVMLFSLEKLGFNQNDIEKFRYLIRKPHGVIFLTGPTGSGKTTSLYACLNEINSSKRKIITIEDPVEYEMEGITQVQVNPKVKFTFSTGLRSLLRHDPDVIMVGEVRDLETAEIAIRTALTGHLVFSTLHTNDSASGITRLVDMGVEPYLVASSVEAFVAQRLIRVNCPECKQEDKGVLPSIREEIARSLKLDNADDVKIYRGMGCNHCHNTGFYGRKAIYEILMLNNNIRAAILEKPRSDYIKRTAMKEGLVTLRQNGWSAVCEGITTPEEVMNATVSDDALKELNEQEAQAAKSSAPAAAQSKQAPLISTKAQVLNAEPSLSAKKNDYDSRIYERTTHPVEICYRIARRDPTHKNKLISDGDEFRSQTKDISAGGLRFSSKVLLSVGTVLDLAVTLQEGQESFQCLGKVCRVEEDSEESFYTIIVYYMDMTGENRSAINKFVEKKK